MTLIMLQVLAPNLTAAGVLVSQSAAGPATDPVTDSATGWAAPGGFPLPALCWWRLGDEGVPVQAGARSQWGRILGWVEVEQV